MTGGPRVNHLVAEMRRMGACRVRSADPGPSRPRTGATCSTPGRFVVSWAGLPSPSSNPGSETRSGGMPTTPTGGHHFWSDGLSTNEAGDRPDLMPPRAEVP